ncbi:MAG TPA: NADH-quinone oxidoreductase subunit NuoG [Acidobacteriaceae bacterium]|nr:NADH-quinone oxidoreductase subunit NuoG [Acidobacteriaceae bacterium]
MADVTLTVDGKTITAPAGTLLLEACRKVGIEIPAFCYYPGLSLQAACRMCLVRIEKMPKLQTACTTPVAEGMIVSTETDEIKQARKAMLELVLANHPLDCPVCDAGGECELQDMTFKYGAGGSQFVEIKNHREEQQWSPVVFFDRPRCILCYRCVRVCNEGMDVAALGIQQRNVGSVIAPNDITSLDCEQCGMCIDICPVGALTSDTYRYKTRPWEMTHVGTICTHCGDGCKTTLGVRRSDDGMQIVRGDNRDKSGLNGEFLCVKGRYAFDFANSSERLTQPLVRQPNGEFAAVSWEDAIKVVAKRFRAARDERGGRSIGVIGSTRITNEEAYLLQKIARSAFGTNNIDHHRTTDYVGIVRALDGQKNRFASIADAGSAPAILILGNDPTEQHPLLAWNVRTNVRHNGARIYLANHRKIKLHRQAKSFIQIPADGYEAFAHFLGGDEASSFGADAIALRDSLRQEQNLLIVFGSELRGTAISALVKFGLSLPDTKFACLGDYVNSRGAADMGLYPDLLPGYQPIHGNSAIRAEYGDGIPRESGLDLAQMFEAAARNELAALYVVGDDPVERLGIAEETLHNTFLVVQDMFLTATAKQADVVLPTANLYEKSGTVTNTFGDLQLVKKAADRAGVRSDLELIVRIADTMGEDVHTLVPFGKGVRADMGQSRGAQSGEADRHGIWLAAHNLEPKLSPFDPNALLDEIQRLVPGYDFDRLDLLGGTSQQVQPAGDGLIGISQLADRPDGILPSGDTLFTSGTLGHYSEKLNEVEVFQTKKSMVAAD